jgi:hypothetical protein
MKQCRKFPYHAVGKYSAQFIYICLSNRISTIHCHQLTSTASSSAEYAICGCINKTTHYFLEFIDEVILDH